MPSRRTSLQERHLERCVDERANIVRQTRILPLIRIRPVVEPLQHAVEATGERDVVVVETQNGCADELSCLARQRGLASSGNASNRDDEGLHRGGLYRSSRLPSSAPPRGGARACCGPLQGVAMLVVAAAASGVR